MKFYHPLQKWKAFCEKSRIYQDFFRGIAYARDWIIQSPEAAFYKAEDIRFHYRLEKIKKNIFNEYLQLGRNAIDGITGGFPHPSEEDVERVYQRITSLMDDLQRIEAEREELAISIASRIKGIRPKPAELE
jgi:hypothetical protein